MRIKGTQNPDPSSVKQCICLITENKLKYLFTSCKKERNLAICNNVDKPRDTMLSVISQTQKGMVSLMCRILKKHLFKVKLVTD